MKTRGAWFAAGALFLLAGCGKVEWKEHVSADGGYRVLMPGTVETDTQTEETDAGPLTYHFATVKVGEGVYVAAYADLLPKAPSDFQAGIQGMAKQYQGKILDDQETTIAGHKGHAFELRTQQPKGFAAGRIFIANGRLYQLVVRGPDARATAPDVRKFFDSFQLQDPLGK